MSGFERETLGRYEIVGILGAGGMGEVYRARDTQLDRLVAIKVIHEDVANKRSAVDDEPQLQEIADVAELCEESLDIDPDSYLIRGNLAYSYASGADPSKTEGAARKAMELAELELETNPGDPELLCHLAGFHAFVGERDEGVVLLAGNHPT